MTVGLVSSRHVFSCVMVGLIAGWAGLGWGGLQVPLQPTTTICTPCSPGNAMEWAAPGSRLID